MMSPRTTSPACETLEGRRLLTSAFHPSMTATIAIERAEARVEQASAMAKLVLDYRKMAADVQQMQVGSDVTMTEVQAFSRDLSAIAATGGTLPPATATSVIDRAEYDVAYRIDYATIEAHFSTTQWAAKESAIVSDFATLGMNPPHSLVDQMMTDVKAIATSANVSVDENDQYWDDADAVLADMKAVPNAPGTMDPFTYLENHLNGFVPGAHPRVGGVVFFTHRNPHAPTRPTS